MGGQQKNRRRGLKARWKQRMSFVLTALGLRKRGFYTPYAYDLDAFYDLGPYPAVEALFETARPAISSFIDGMAACQSQLVATTSGPDALDWTNHFIPPLDAAAIYAGITRFRPEKIIEVGSGTSTHFMARAISDAGLGTRLTCIDPMPRVDVSALPATIYPRVLQPDDIDRAASLAPGDVLFIDSSHILLQGMDCDILMNRIFPALAAGVFVHVHDIFLPYGYPPHWREFRFNEQQALIPWLLSGQFEVVFASHFAHQRMASEIAEKLPNLSLITPRPGGSLWMRKA